MRSLYRSRNAKTTAAFLVTWRMRARGSEQVRSSPDPEAAEGRILNQTDRVPVPVPRYQGLENVAVHSVGDLVRGVSTRTAGTKHS